MHYGAYRNRLHFAGGADLDGCGAWGMNFQGLGQTWRKSAFFFGDRIVLLGSGITNSLKRPTVTTLFQNFLPAEQTPTVVNGEKITGLGVEKTVSADAALWILINRGVGFYLPRGHAPFRLTRKRQRWTYIYSRYLKDPKAHPELNRCLHTRQVRTKQRELARYYRSTFGEFATGWLDHGVSPRGASYHFVMRMNADADKMRAFAKAMSNARTAPYRTLRCDNAAHVLYDKEHDVFAFVLFEPFDSPPFKGSPILAANKPCFVMTRAKGDVMELSVSDPAHKQIDWAAPTTIRVTLTGRWRIPSDAFTPQIIVEKDKQTLSSAATTLSNNTTTLTINGEANAVYRLKLQAAK